MAFSDPDGSTHAMSKKTIAFLAFRGFRMLDLVGPLETFDIANTVGGQYQVRILAKPSGSVMASNGLAVGGATALRDIDPTTMDTVIVAGGHAVHDQRSDQETISWLRDAARSARRVCSVCSGAFLLAEAGLLDGRRATTHWGSAARLASEFPDVIVDPNVLYQRADHIWTAAGITAGMDLALALVEDDHGHDVAMATAREMVVFLKRPGGQSQFSAELLAQERGGDRFDAVRSWIFANLDARLDIDSLADRAGMSRRGFQRRFAEAFGVPPAKFVERARVEAARRDLEDGADGIDRIAALRGFGDPERMRRAFHRVLGVSPADYRARFRDARNAA
jgi:transcriptional regulator GlxA family with amidase domain